MLKRFLLIFFCAGVCSLSGPMGQAIAAEPGDLVSRLDRLATRGPLAKASVGIYVERASDGSQIYARGADRLLIPASNQKILTTLAALHRFGPTHRFSTRIWAPKAPDVEGLVDELIVEGGGDPAMNSEDWWRLAADLRREGLRGVRGDIRVDDSHFDAPGWHPSWGRVSARAYHAPIGALTANYGSFFVSVAPQKTVGSAAAVYVDPPVAYLRLSNRAKTGGTNARPRLRVDRLPGAEGSGEEIVRVDGIVRQGDAADVIPRSVLDPGLYAGSLLALQLEANGIFLDGGVRRAPRANAALALVLSRPGRALSEIVQLCMKFSNNSIAESLVKNLGAYAETELELPAGTGRETIRAAPRQGSWVGGIRALREELGELGVDLGEARIVDGSGLSIQNRVTPRIFVQALRAGRASFDVGPEFMAAMPIAERDGTLRKRLSGGNGRIRAKTGLLADAAVSSLSGYAERADGEMLIFSILVNGHTGGSGAAMKAVDALAGAILEAPLPERSQTSR
jgi:D-alanyl-D-alanine carboxypeptidase/D-alanyl-D-alanine-endopeptidase (penicillin-binding protein 4)